MAQWRPELGPATSWVAPELARLNDLAAQAFRGRSGVLAIVGDPGSGKSTLLSAVNGLTGFTVLRASGSELEQGMALGMIAAEAEHQPVIVLVDDLHWLDPSSASVPRAHPAPPPGLEQRRPQRSRTARQAHRAGRARGPPRNMPDLEPTVD